MEPEKKNKKLDDLISAAIGREDVKFDFGKWKAEHEKEIRLYESQQAKSAEHRGSSGLLKLIRRGGVLRYAAAAVIVIGALIGMQHLTEGLTTIAWADVAERFRSVPFFSAAIYIKDDVTAEPKQIELWMSREGKARLRTGTQVIFGDQGKVIKAFDIKTRSAVEADEHAGFLLGKLGAAHEFSLDSVIKVISGGKMEDVTPLINPDAVISQDMVVFDIQSTISPEWLRIWALRQSRLPVRIRVWDPRDGDGTDVVFSYSTGQSAEFFDPNAFDAMLKEASTKSRISVAYAFLKDPGGRSVTPEDIFEKSGYHIPLVKRAGMTKEGVFWVLAGKGRNRTPKGRTFYGFSRMEDDLGRRYLSVGGGHRLRDDTSYDAFVPVDYPFDQRKPGRITLYCQTQDYDPSVKPELIGTVDLTEWEQDAESPNLFGKGTRDATGFKIALTYRLEGEEHAERRAKLLETIPKWSERRKDISVLIFWMRQAEREKDFDEVIIIGEILTPLLLEKPKQADRYAFRDYITALAKRGRLDDAKALFERIDKVEDLTPEKHKKDYYNQYLEHMARALSYGAKLTVDKVGYVMSVDIKNDKRFDNFRGWDWSAEFDKPKYKNWERRLGELAEYYKTHPLPERMELLEQDSEEEYACRIVKMPGIETHHAESLRGKLGSHIYFYKYPESTGRVRIEGNIGDIELRHDWIYRVGTKQAERIGFLLDYFGLEVAEVNEPRRVWTAHHDGRELKDYKEVKAPVPYDNSGTRKAGVMMSMSSGGFDLEYLFRRFTDDQNEKTKANGIIIIDKTGLTERVSLEGPGFKGEEGAKIARKWFKDEIGVTFTEEVRTMTTYVIRKRQ